MSALDDAIAAIQASARHHADLAAARRAGTAYCPISDGDRCRAYRDIMDDRRAAGASLDEATRAADEADRARIRERLDASFSSPLPSEYGRAVA